MRVLFHKFGHGDWLKNRYPSNNCVTKYNSMTTLLTTLLHISPSLPLGLKPITSPLKKFLSLTLS